MKPNATMLADFYAEAAQAGFMEEKQFLVKAGTPIFVFDADPNKWHPAAKVSRMEIRVSNKRGFIPSNKAALV